MTTELAPSRIGQSQSSVIELASIDDYLGPAQQRFFGSGYRRSTYRLHPGTHGDTDLAATVDISYPTDWSRKKAGSDLRPHLSTVDVMILGIRSAEALLVGVVGLTPDQTQAAQIQKLTVRAGSRPEESLTGLPLRALLKKSVPVPEAGGRKVDSNIIVQVGVMRATVVLRHEAPANPGAGVIDYALLGEDPDRHWGTGYRHDEQQLTAVRADTDTLTAHATVMLHHSADCGIRASHAPRRATFIDAFVSLLQLGQVLMYELDQIDRAHSETLWMQQLTLRAVHSVTDTVPGRQTSVDADLGIANHQLLTLPTGNWRNLDFQGEAGGVEMSATFAHRIPHQEGN